jgi:hypothetical protein
MVSGQVPARLTLASVGAVVPEGFEPPSSPFPPQLAASGGGSPKGYETVKMSISILPVMRSE